MKKEQLLLNPNLKSALLNLDLNIESELNRYKDQKKESLSITKISQNEPIININAHHIIEEEKKEFNQFETIKVAQSEGFEQETEEDVMPVAYRMVEEKKTLLDWILTPWAIFSLILFLLANAILIVNLTNKSKELETVDNLDSQSNQQEIVINQQPQEETNEKILPESDNKKENQNIKENPNNTQNDGNLLIPPPPLTISPSQPPPPENQNITPYPDLSSALLSKSQPKSNTSNNSKSSNYTPPPPSPIITPPPVNYNPPQIIPPPVIETPPKPEEEINLNATATKTETNSESVNNLSAYQVMTDYLGIESFEAIQKILPDALITNIGAEMKIQLGIFNDEQEANQLIAELKQKQITAYLLKVENQK